MAAILASLLLSAVPTGFADAGTKAIVAAVAARLDLAHVLPCPPESASEAIDIQRCTSDPAQERRDLQALLDARAAASPAERQEAIADAGPPSLAAFARPIWARLAVSNQPCPFAETAAASDKDALENLLPATAALFRTARHAERGLVGDAKRAFGRTRPFNLHLAGIAPDAPLVPVEKLRNSPSYPSGHATFGMLAATLLAEILPERRDILFARAQSYAWHRVVVGVHFPSDVEAGKRAGTLIAAALLQDPAFRQKLDDARMELRRKLCE